MDEDRSSTHDPAARLGRASDVPDGIERLAGPPATPDRPEAPAFCNGAAATTEVAEPVARPAADTDADTTNGHAGADDDDDVDVEDDDGHDSDDPPPRWAGGREPGSTPPPGPAEPTGAEQPARRPSGRSAYWAAAVLVIFGAIAAIGLVKSGGDDPEPSAAQDRGETTATPAADDEGGEGEAAGPSGEKPSTSVEDHTTTTAGAQAPAVGECAVLDVAPEPDEYIQVPCDAPTAAVQLSQVVPSPAPPGSHCPQGTDTVAQVTADTSVGRAAPELWCLRNVAAPHPGDPGGGGGELVVGDCLGAAPSGQSIEVPCDGTGLPPEYLVGWLPDANGVCPAESVATVNLTTPFPGAYCLRYKP